ncbi:MAG: cobalamin adenosyltransferase [Synergistaceae bacterium]|jgi:ethanolamine utilization cobalamin adenosyltransferase|nr:cobalamin adenosyltransferase [Synergistaceae bacterium]
MSVLTEAELRILLKDEDLDELREYRVAADVIVTPSARGYLTDHKIDLVIGDKRVIKNPPVKDARERARAPEPKKTRVNEPSGVEKPEYMTNLNAHELVSKDHKTIKLRGGIDGLEAKILETQMIFHQGGRAHECRDLGEILDYTRLIMRGEVLGEEVPPPNLFGMDSAEIRDRSHHPRKYYGVPHFMPLKMEDGEVVLRLNVLRTMVREVEISAFEAFRDEAGVPSRQDILTALNRMSSAFYVMMLRSKAGEYGS